MHVLKRQGAAALQKLAEFAAALNRGVRQSSGALEAVRYCNAAPAVAASALAAAAACLARVLTFSPRRARNRVEDASVG